MPIAKLSTKTIRNSKNTSTAPPAFPSFFYNSLPEPLLGTAGHKTVRQFPSRRRAMKGDHLSSITASEPRGQKRLQLPARPDHTIVR